MNNAPPKGLFAGLDWASKTHAVCVVDASGKVRAQFEIANTGKSFTGLIKRLVKLEVAAVSIERGDGPLVEAMLDADLKVAVITGRQVKNLRSRYSASGAKSDPNDAYLLADVLRTDWRRMKFITRDSDATVVLRSLTRTRKQLVQNRTGLLNQLTAELERVFPGAIGLFADLDSKVAVAFLRRYPTHQSASKLNAGRLDAFLRRISYSGRQPVHVLLDKLQTAPDASISAEQAEGRANSIKALLTVLESVRDQIKDLEGEIVERLETHADAHIFTSLPRAGKGVRAASLLAEIGDDRARFGDEEDLAALAGVAPVTKASGKLHTVGFRWSADKKLLNAITDFADDSRHASPWAKDIYDRARARGKTHSHAVRILARAWIRVIWRCWQDNTAYNPLNHGGAMRLHAA